MTAREQRDKRVEWLKRQTWLPILLYLGVAYSGALLFTQGPLRPSENTDAFDVFSPLSLSGGVLFSSLFVSGLILFALVAAARRLSGHGPLRLRIVGGIIALSIAVSVLLAADAAQRAQAAGAEPVDSLWGLLYTLLTQRQSLLILTLLMLVVAIIVSYYVVRSLFSVQYEGTGVQFRLPGQTVFYVPIYPQCSWQDTHIELREGQTVTVEISGYVSPGALGDLAALQKQKDAVMDWQGRGSKLEEYGEIIQDVTWPYTDAAGYQEEWYKEGTMIEILKSNPIYRQPEYYKKDTFLTIMGLPHNRVVGKIVDEGEEPPRKATEVGPGYDWSKPEDRDVLLDLSSKNYPIRLNVKCSGNLWVVINDVESIRWDNGGLFFLKLTRHGIF